MPRLLVRAAAVLLLLALPAAGGEEPRPARNVILFGWDGAQRNHVLECLAEGRLPTLARLAKEGALVRIDIEGATDTKAGWSQILTGCYPETTGVYSNRRFRPIPAGLTVFERLEKHFGPDRFATLAVIGKKGNVGCAGPRKVPVKARRRKRKAGAGKRPGRTPVLRDVPGEPYFLTKDAMDVFENGLTLDAAVGARAIELIEREKDRPFFLFVHFAEVDHSGHAHGENSREYDDAIRSNDRWTGKVLDRVAELGLAGETLAYVTMDHGFDEGKRAHKFAPYVLLGTNDPRVRRDGLRQDVAPTILDAFGIDVARLDPPLDGVSLRRPCERGEVRLGPRPGDVPERKRKPPAEVRIEAEDYSFGSAEVAEAPGTSGGRWLRAVTAEKGPACYAFRVPRRGVYHGYLRYSSSRDRTILLSIDDREVRVEVPATLSGGPRRRWVRLFRERLTPGVRHDIIVWDARLLSDCFLLTTRPGLPDPERVFLPEPPALDGEARAKLARSERPVRAAWIEEAKGYRLPAWFDAERVCAHTRLSPPWRKRPLFSEAAAKLASLGFRVFSRHIKSGAEGAWWPSSVGHVEEWARERNVAKEIIGRAKEAGLRILVYYRHSEDAAAAEAHPDWVCRDAAGEIVRGARGPMLCLSSPWAGQVRTRLLELLDMGADGFYFDYVHMPKEGCWCARCRAEFERETGLAPPPKANPADPVYRRFVDQKNAVIERTFLDWRRAVHARNPEAVLLVGSNTWPGFAERHTTGRLYRIADSVKTEWSKGPAGTVGPGAAALSFGWDLARDAADGRPAHVWVCGLVNEVSAVFATAGIVAHGSVANLDQTEAEIPDAATFRKAVAMGNRAADLLAGSRPVRTAIVHCSERARDSYGADPGAALRATLRPAFDAYRACLRARMPVGMITDSQLEEGVPADCRLLFLPDPEHLTAPMLTAVEEFSRRGGRVVTRAADLDAKPIVPPVVVEGGPDTLHSCLFATEGRKRVVVALANDFSFVTTGKAATKPARLAAFDPDAVPPPVRGVTVRFRLGATPKRVVLAATGGELPMKVLKTGVEVEVPEFAALAVVAAEL